MILAPTPEVTRLKVRVGAPVRKAVPILKAYLACLRAQDLPPNVDLSYHFILDDHNPEAERLLRDFVSEYPDSSVEVEADIAKDFMDDHPVTHQWQHSAMARVGQLKNRIIQQALADQCTALWFVDSDLLCDAGTLQSLWYADVPVCSAVFWTRWNNEPKAIAGPQVWLRHPYQLEGRGYPEAGAFRARLMSRQLTQVWGLGACTLIRRAVLEAGVNFSYVPGVPTDGMMSGEDRHFCLQCEAKHIAMIADPWPHIFHVYHPHDQATMDAWMNRLADIRTKGIPEPKWVSLRLHMLEPVPVGPNQMGHVPAHSVRVRIGSGQLLPDLEAQVLQHLNGQPFIAKVSYPMHYPVQWLRGQRRLMEVRVVDAKSDCPMPVIEDEYLGAYDLATYSRDQQDDLYAAPKRQKQEGLRDEPENGTEGREAEETGASYQLRRSA